MNPRRIVLLVSALVVAATISGCSATPSPTPSETPRFATEEDAFAAAEETYRAYVDALNQVDLADPETFEAVFAWTTGELNASDRANLSQMHADKLAKSGSSWIDVIILRSFDATSSRVDLAVCLDVSGVGVTDASGTSVVDSDRVGIQTLLVTAIPDDGTASDMAIASIGGREGAPAC